MFLKGEKIGKYEIIRALGSGGFGTVYLARDTWLNKKVALKIPHKQSKDLFKLLKEPRLQAVLNHPNVVQLITAEKQGSIFFMVMEYVKGETLEKILEREKTLDLKTAIDYIKQICFAVDHAHNHKIIHRDLRPSNIIISEKGILKITDFGTSTWLENIQYASTRIGSPPYMAPEQFKGKATYASDIYSIGCIFYEMLVGRPPIYDSDPFKILEKAEKGEITPPKLKNSSIPKEINDIIMKCLEVKIENRFKKASHIVREIEKYKEKPDYDLELESIRERIRARERRKDELCWNCRQPLPPKAKRCPRCGEKI